MSVIVGRSRIATKYGIVAASQPLAAQAGVQILERGGNAIDAAIATNAVMGLVEPQSNGIGGDLFAIVYEAKTGALRGLNACGCAPAGLTPALLKSRGHTQMPQAGIHSVTVPGAVAGWEALRATLGSLPFADLLAPAIAYADEGFPVSDVIAAHWAVLAEKLAAEPSAAATYLPNGRSPRGGEVFRNAELASSLRLIAAHGAAGFYEGATADAMLMISADHGGTMTAADLRGVAPEWVVPISTTYRDWTVYELPPNTQGIAALMMLNVMEQFPLAAYGFHSARALHVMIEAKKLAYADMLRHVGDTRFSTPPVEAMLDKAHAKKRAGEIGTAAARDVQPSIFDGLTNSSGHDTIYLSVIDRHGNIVSLIQSIYEGFGTAIVPSGTGFALHNRGALFTLDESHPNTLAPCKRPLHTIIPGFMQRGETRIGFGIMGGFNQAQAHAQFVANIADYGHGHSAGPRGGPIHEADLRGRRCRHRGARAGIGEGRARRSRPRGHGRAVQDRHVRARAGGDERRIGRAFRGVGAATRRRRDSRSTRDFRFRSSDLRF